MNQIKCSKCGSLDVYIKPPEPAQKESTVPTMEEFLNQIHAPMTLVYKLTTLCCKKCGHTVSR